MKILYVTLIYSLFVHPQEAPNHIAIRIINTTKQYGIAPIAEQLHAIPSIAQAEHLGMYPSRMDTTERNGILSTWNNKIAVAACIAIGAYALINSTLWYYYHTICSHNPWISWQNAPEDGTNTQVAQRLYADIVTHYANHTDYGFLTPLMLFLQDISATLNTINSFEGWHGWLESLHISRLCVYQHDRIKSVREIKKKLIALKELILVWAQQPNQADQIVS